MALYRKTMAHIKTKEQVIEQIKYAQEAIKDKNLKGLAESIAANPKHPLHKALNSYPALPFEISADDLKEIEILKTFPSPLPDDHQWTPLAQVSSNHSKIPQNQHSQKHNSLIINGWIFKMPM